MVRLRTFRDVHRELSSLYGANSSVRYTLERMLALLDFLGNPQNELRIVHVAGTSGKTSTAYYAAALLKGVGYKVGLTISPHVNEVNERLQLNLVLLPEAEFCAALENFLVLVAQSGVQPSYFELMIAFAFYEFHRRHVDYAVVEVGLGGLLDATNTIARPDKLCIITDIGLDHTEILGSDLATIAAKKAGIIQPHNQVFMYKQSPAVMSAVRQTAQEKQAHIHIVQLSNLPEVKALPLFQQRNFSLAFGAITFLLERAGRKSLTFGQRQAAAHTYIPARMEVTCLDGKVLIIDGAHNAQKIELLLKSVRARFGKKPLSALVAFVSGNEERWQCGLDVLLPEVKELIITSFHAEQDLPKTGVPVAEIRAYCEARQFTYYQVEADPKSAYKLLSANTSPLHLVVGSFYLLNHIRPLVGRGRTH